MTVETKSLCERIGHDVEVHPGIGWQPAHQVPGSSTITFRCRRLGCGRLWAQLVKDISPPRTDRDTKKIEEMLITTLKDDHYEE